jgi:hypothetical protein
MGQYYYICNLNKKQYLNAHKFGDGLKLMEFGSSGRGTMMALALLLSDGYERMAGQTTIIGSWAGDRIVIAGDYSENAWEKEAKEERVNLHEYAEEHYTDISIPVRQLLIEMELFSPEGRCIQDY